MLVKDFIQQNRGRGNEDVLAVLLFGLRLVEYSDKEFGGIIDIVAGYIHESGVSHGRRKNTVLGIAMAFLFKFPVSSKATTPFRFDSTDGSTDSDTAPGHTFLVPHNAHRHSHRNHGLHIGVSSITTERDILQVTLVSPMRDGDAYS